MFFYHSIVGTLPLESPKQMIRLLHMIFNSLHRLKIAHLQFFFQDKIPLSNVLFIGSNCIRVYDYVCSCQNSGFNTVIWAPRFFSILLDHLPSFDLGGPNSKPVKVAIPPKAFQGAPSYLPVHQLV